MSDFPHGDTIDGDGHVYVKMFRPRQTGKELRRDGQLPWQTMHLTAPALTAKAAASMKRAHDHGGAYPGCEFCVFRFDVETAEAVWSGRIASRRTSGRRKKEATP